MHHIHLPGTFVTIEGQEGLYAIERVQQGAQGQGGYKLAGLTDLYPHDRLTPVSMMDTPATTLQAGNRAAPGPRRESRIVWLDARNPDLVVKARPPQLAQWFLALDPDRRHRLWSDAHKSPRPAYLDPRRPSGDFAVIVIAKNHN